jgi:hypothetical protein
MDTVVVVVYLAEFARKQVSGLGELVLHRPSVPPTAGGVALQVGAL